MDEDGFIFAKLNDKSGFIPSNLVEEITEEDELSQIESLLQEQRSRATAGGTADSTSHPRRNMNGNGNSSGEEVDGEGGSPHTMKALFDYDPARDSPNANSEVELAISEGDVLTVFGKPDGDGFFKVWDVAVFQE